MNIKLVKLTAEYKKQLTDMMDEWLAVEKDFSPYAIRKNDYHDFEYYLENLETKEGEKPGLVPDSVYFCLDIDRNIFVGAVNIRHYLNESLYKSGGHIGDGIRPSERRKGYATAMIGLALEKCKELGINKVLMTCDRPILDQQNQLRITVVYWSLSLKKTVWWSRDIGLRWFQFELRRCQMQRICQICKSSCGR